ncbi:molybdenum cofactor guanylyltransferase [Eubacteriaceae bacterium ES3]|nr:molybdenum cofactor guanylyltransferase [Eubacteriaceae bacterium ES3]
MEKFKTAAILTGGLSRRMGFDKKFLKINGERILNRIIKQLSEDFEDIIIVGSTPEDLPDLKGIRDIFPDEVEVSASLAGIYTGLQHSQSQFLYVIACDMPIYNRKYIAYMKSQIALNSRKKGCVTRYKEWIEPFNAFYSTDLLENIEEFLMTGRKSIHRCLEPLDLYFIPENTARSFSPNWDMFCNLNTPRELKEHLQKNKQIG